MKIRTDAEIKAYAAEYLNQVGMIDAKLKVIDANIERIRRELHAIGDISVSGQWPDGQPHGTKTTDPTGSKATKLVDMTNEKRDALVKELQDLEYDQIITRSELWSRRMEVLETIEKVYDSEDAMSKTYYRLLIMRYVEFASWEEIAVELNYTWRHTIRLHGEALKRIEVVING